MPIADIMHSRYLVRMDALEQAAYTELMLGCAFSGCAELFAPCLNKPATDPVEEWAKAIGRLARIDGWSADISGRPLCPTHAKTA